MPTKRRIILNDRSVELEIADEANGSRVRVDNGDWVNARMRLIGLPDEGLFVLFLNDRPHLVALTPGEGGHDATIGGRILSAVTDPRRVRALGRGEVSGSGVDSGPVTIRSNITGMIVDVLVRTGRDVSQGETLLIVEAMKMQNEVKAPRSGRVAKINVGKGDRVERGKAMLIIEPPEDVGSRVEPRTTMPGESG